MSRGRALAPAARNAVGLTVDNVETVRAALLSWYDAEARTLPWRIGPGEKAPVDPYRVWLSEVMLQQTTVAAVIPYFRSFLEVYPTVKNLAEAPREEVLRRWAGLGYYSRARNLHAAAQALQARGGFPETEAELISLPGIGAYTAAAVAAIAFGQPTNVVDGNVERVMARLHAVEDPLPRSKALLRKLAGAFVTSERPGDWAQALMDLGAGVCTPRAPRCGVCPVARSCAGLAAGDPQRFPVRTPKERKPQRFGVAFFLIHEGRVLLRARPDEGLLGGMLGLPSTPFATTPWSPDQRLAHAPSRCDFISLGVVRHVFTHFDLALEVVGGSSDAEGTWISLDDLAKAGMPTVFTKAAALGVRWASGLPFNPPLPAPRTP
jgi:A/G-specific adenine glycosylase